MIHYITGNLLESSAQALVNTVNTEGVMGKGIALQFKKQFPQNFKLYAKACKEGVVTVGKMFVTEEETLLQGGKVIINSPTKTTWKKPSEYLYIKEGLADLKKVIQERKLQSIALPSLGAGNGGLDWEKVKLMIEEELAELNCEIYLYQPNFKVAEQLKKERVALTPARAMLLAVLYDLAKEGEFVSEFAGEKICYFLKRFGAEAPFKNLAYKAHFYGPYSGTVKHVLYHLNGSYLTGYSSKDKKPFEAIGIIMDTETDVLNYLTNLEDKQYEEIVQKTKSFLSGFYSSFGLELLSTIDYICQTNKTMELKNVKEALSKWSERKSKLFSEERFLDIALKQLKSMGLCID